jgi:cyclase
MLQTRLIPCLLVDKNLHLVKTIRFSDRHYLGDPLNAAYVYSGFEVDELIVLDIDASLSNRCISLDFVESLARFTKMPLTVGGGISDIVEIRNLIAAGVERVILGSVLNKNFDFLSQSIDHFGSSTISIIINVMRKKNEDLFGYFGKEGYNQCYPLIDLVCKCEKAGAGEIVLNHVDHDGTLKGFDLDIYATMNDLFSVPMVALGGCGSEKHIEDLINQTPISGVAAGSLFVYAPNTREILLNYPIHKSALREKLKNMKYQT